MTMCLNQHINQKEFIRTRAHAFVQKKRAESSSQYIDDKAAQQNFSVFITL